MRKSMRPALTLLLIAAWSAGCGGRRDVYDRPLETLGPFPVSSGLCFLNRTLGELVRVQVARDSVELQRIALVPGPAGVTEVDHQIKLAVLHDDADAPGITLLENVTLHQVAWLPLGEQFDRLAVSPSSRFGVAHFSGAASNPGAIRNLNQVQVVDFRDGVAHPPHALQTGGLSPRGIEFLGSDGAFAEIAVVLVDNGLVILDLESPAAEPLWVRFTNSPGGLAVPAEVVFGSFHHDGGYIYVRLQGSDDVLSVHLVREAGQLRRTINFLNVPSGSGPSDLLVFGDTRFHDKVFVVYGSSGGGAAVLDANAIQTDERTFSFGVQVLSSRRLLSEDGAREFAAVWGSGSSANRLFVVDPLSGEVETIHLQDAFHQVGGPADGSFLVAFHPVLGQSGTPGLRVIRLAHDASSGRLSHRIATYSLDRALQASAFSPDGRTMLGALKGSNQAFVLDLDSGEYAALSLDLPPTAAGFVPETGWAYFQHPHALGSLTLVPLQGFDREHAVLLEGFVLAGLLDPR